MTASDNHEFTELVSMVGRHVDQAYESGYRAGVASVSPPMN